MLAFLCPTAAVDVTVITAGGVTVVPAPALLGALLNLRACLRVVVKHVASGAPELVRVLSKVASEEELAVLRMRMEGVLLLDTVGADELLQRARESVDNFGGELSGLVEVAADASIVRNLVFKCATADLDVED